MLLQVTAVAQRVLGFSVRSPLPKLLTGLDLLLQRLMTWEAQAHRGISVTPHIEAVTNLVIRWRKLELATWPDLFAVVQSRFQRQAAQKWFDIYVMVTGEMEATEAVTEAAGRGDGKVGTAMEGQQTAAAAAGGIRSARGNGGPAQLILQGLEALMQASSLGEFGARLQLLQSFQQHAALLARHRDAAPHLASLAHGLWNLHRFYLQFLPNVEAAVQQGQKPLQREVRMFVKLAKWKDTNYASVREAADKTHRKLHKFLKKYATILETPIGPTLQGVATGLEFIASDYAMSVMREPLVMAALRDRTAFLLAPGHAATSLAYLQPALADAAYLAATAGDTAGAIAALPAGDTADSFPLDTHPPSKLFLRMRGVLARRVFTEARSINIAAVDAVCRGIIGRIRWLQEWDRAAVEEQHEELRKARAAKEEDAGVVGAAAKRRQESKKDKTTKATKRKHSKLMKQASLAVLFKKLAKMGLSYRRPAHTLQTIDDMLLVPPIVGDATAAVAAGTKPQTATAAAGDAAGEAAQMIERCDEYYYRILARASAFDAATALPAKDVNPQDAERCIGFGRHLLQAVYVQRRFAANYAAELRAVAALEGTLAATIDPALDAATLPPDFAPPGQRWCERAARQLRQTFAEVQALLGDSALLLRADTTLEPQQCATITDSLNGCLAAAAQGAELSATVADKSFHSTVDLVTVRELRAQAEALLDGLAVFARQLEAVPWLAGACATLDTAAAVLASQLASLEEKEESAAVVEEEETGVADGRLMRAFLAAHGRLAARLLLPVQALAKRTAGISDGGESGVTAAMETVAMDEQADEVDGVPQPPPEEEEEAALASNHLFALHQQLVGDVKRLGLPAVNRAAAELMEAFAAITNTCSGDDSALPAATRILAALHPMLAQFRLLADRLQYELLAMHRTTCKLEYILLGLFKDLLVKGCAALPCPALPCDPVPCCTVLSGLSLCRG